MKYIIPTSEYDNWRERAEADLIELGKPCKICEAADCVGPTECFSDKHDYAVVEITALGLIEHRKIWESCK